MLYFDFFLPECHAGHIPNPSFQPHDATHVVTALDACLLYTKTEMLSRAATKTGHSMGMQHVRYSTHSIMMDQCMANQHKRIYEGTYGLMDGGGGREGGTREIEAKKARQRKMTLRCVHACEGRVDWPFL